LPARTINFFVVLEQPTGAPIAHSYSKTGANRPAALPLSLGMLNLDGMTVFRFSIGQLFFVFIMLNVILEYSCPHLVFKKLWPLPPALLRLSLTCKSAMDPNANARRLSPVHGSSGVVVTGIIRKRSFGCHMHNRQVNANT